MRNNNDENARVRQKRVKREKERGESEEKGGKKGGKKRKESKKNRRKREKGAEGKGDRRTKRYGVIIMTGVEVSPSRRAIAPNCIGKSERLQR